MFKADKGVEGVLESLLSNNEIYNVDPTIFLSGAMPNSLDDLDNNTLYRMQPTQPVSWLPTNFNYNGQPCYLIKYTNFYDNQPFWNVIIYDYKMAPIYEKQIENGVDYGWVNVAAGDVAEYEQIYVGAEESYTKLTDALSYAYTKGNVKITVRKGTYNILNEINAESAGAGPLIGNNTYLYFEEGAVVSCDYTGNNSAVKTLFSPFNAGVGDYTIENMNIGASNVRYCVHDELESNPTPYKHEYINCDMFLDNSNNDAWDSPQCIGGGLGEKGYIIVRGGRYNSAPEDPACWYGAISYHNGSTSGCKSHIEIHNVFFGNSGVRLGYYGSSTDMTKVFVSGCSLSTPPVSRSEIASASINNIEVFEWNNKTTKKVASYSENYTIYPRTLTFTKSQLGIPESSTITEAYVYHNDYAVSVDTTVNITSGNSVTVTINNNASADCMLYIFAVYE